MQSPDITDKLHRSNNNMDAIRYLLAFSVIVAHFNTLCGFSIPWPIDSFIGVSGFFAMSGFLIFKSYDNCTSVRQFLLKRGRRILPPYFLIVLLCAVALVGLSTNSVADYFFSLHWWKYLLSNLLFLNFLEPSLPGVFSGPEFYTPAVNGSLWTMKVEWCLYLSVPIVAWIIRRLHLRFSRRNLLFLLIIGISIAYRIIFLWAYLSSGSEMCHILSRQFFGQLSFFYVGVLIYHNLERFMRYRWWLLAVFITGWWLRGFDPFLAVAIEPFACGGLILWLSLVGKWGHYLSRHDNVSYDMYLFHFPIMQVAVALGLTSLGETACFIIVIAAVTLFSFLSWNLIGKRFIRG